MQRTPSHARTHTPENLEKNKNKEKYKIYPVNILTMSDIFSSELSPASWTFIYLLTHNKALSVRV